MRVNMRQSQAKDQKGWPKETGELPSTQKWLYQARAYPRATPSGPSHHLPSRRAPSSNTVAARVPAKCHRLVDDLECWLT